MHRTAADDDRIHLATQLVDAGAGSFTAYPFGLAGMRGDLAVERHGPFGMNHGKACLSPEFEVGCVYAPSSGPPDADFDIDPRSSESCRSFACNLGEGIEHGGNDSDGCPLGVRHLCMEAFCRGDSKVRG